MHRKQCRDEKAGPPVRCHARHNQEQEYNVYRVHDGIRRVVDPRIVAADLVVGEVRQPDQGAVVAHVRASKGEAKAVRAQAVSQRWILIDIARIVVSDKIKGDGLGKYGQRQRRQQHRGRKIESRLSGHRHHLVIRSPRERLEEIAGCPRRFLD